MMIDMTKILYSWDEFSDGGGHSELGQVIMESGALVQFCVSPKVSRIDTDF